MQTRAKTIQALTPLLETKDPTQSVDLSKMYAVTTWLEKKYIKLVKHPDSFPKTFGSHGPHLAARRSQGSSLLRH